MKYINQILEPNSKIIDQSTFMNKSSERRKQQPWDPAEIEQLKSLVKKHGKHKWQFIASKLHWRKPLEWKQKYATLEKEYMNMKKWTIKEESVLFEWIFDFSEKNVKSVVPKLNSRNRIEVRKKIQSMRRQLKDKFFHGFDSSKPFDPWNMIDDLIKKTECKPPDPDEIQIISASIPINPNIPTFKDEKLKQEEEFWFHSNAQLSMPAFHPAPLQIHPLSLINSTGECPSQTSDSSGVEVVGETRPKERRGKSFPMPPDLKEGSS
jgi:hypothetical protein